MRATTILARVLGLKQTKVPGVRDRRRRHGHRRGTYHAGAHLLGMLQARSRCSRHLRGTPLAGGTWTWPACGSGSGTPSAVRAVLAAGSPWSWCRGRSDTHPFQQRDRANPPEGGKGVRGARPEIRPRPPLRLCATPLLEARPGVGKSSRVAWLPRSARRLAVGSCVPLRAGARLFDRSRSRA